ncbi:trypco2 family protein [Yoonia sp. R2-816]|uniref:trypco2 family protein n=1 Tax=Yoonia sp. R2-816 TaxID=3342638 RepID=UPI0037286EE6
MIIRVINRLILTVCVILPSFANAEEVTLSSMIRTLQLSLLDAQENLVQNEMLALSEVAVELNLVNRIEADGRIGFWIIKLGAAQTNSVTSNVRMVLTPPDAGGSENVSAASDAIRSVLSNAIFEGAAARSLAMGGEPPLDAKEFVITLEFALSENADGEISIAVPPIEAGAGGEISASELQRITLTFGE